MRYLIFMGDRYYPSGGWDDYRGAVASMETALFCIDRGMADFCDPWYHVIDTQTGKKVLEHG